MDGNLFYAVRGASIFCVYGTHLRKLDMPATHGSFIRGIPMMNENDCVVGLAANIPTFGACNSPENQNPVIIIADPTGVLPIPDENGNAVMPPMPLEGRLCAPILTGKWCDAKDDTLVDGAPALTVNCTIACATGGAGAVIGFMDNGQGV
jgi:hypothetical protein